MTCPGSRIGGRAGALRTQRLRAVKVRAYRRSRRGSKLDARRDLDRFLGEVERRAFRTAELATGNREDALDIVQDAMFRLARGYDDRDEAQWGPLFHRILQSCIRDWYRRSRVRNRWRVWFANAPQDPRGDPLENQPGIPAPGPRQEAAGQQFTQSLEHALRALPLRQRQAFLLRTWDGFDVAQTAKAMGCSQGSVKTHYSRAVHALRELLRDHWG